TSSKRDWSSDGCSSDLSLLQFGTDTSLSSVRLVGNADDVAAVGQQSSLFTEFLNGCDINTTARSVTKSLCHIRTGLDTTDIALKIGRASCREREHSARS